MEEDSLPIQLTKKETVSILTEEFVELGQRRVVVVEGLLQMDDARVAVHTEPRRLLARLARRPWTAVVHEDVVAEFSLGTTLVDRTKAMRPNIHHTQERYSSSQLPT